MYHAEGTEVRLSNAHLGEIMQIKMKSTKQEIWEASCCKHSLFFGAHQNKSSTYPAFIQSLLHHLIYLHVKARCVLSFLPEAITSGSPYKRM